ncbi:MAG: MvdC/MvdD family ATP grasp protein [Bacteroidota bacterium]
MKKVLIVTHSNEHYCYDLVANALQEEGGEAVRIDTDRYPTEIQLTTDYQNGGLHNYLETPEGRLDLADLTAAWYRRSRIGQKIPGDIDPQLRLPSVEESKRSFMGVLHSLDCFILDPYFHVRQASSKQLQLKIAEQLGIRIPKTMITNNPEEVRRFFRTCPEGIITKMQTSFAVYTEGVENVVFTNIIEESMLDELEGLELCPMTFQEAIPKEVELRVTIVGDQVYSASIDSQSSERAKVDWRKDGHAMIDMWKEHPLPKALEQQLLQLMDAFQLNYGAIDLILHPDGTYYFLEINPAGEFMWLEHAPGFPISRQLAKVLLGKAWRRNEVGNKKSA